MKYIIEEEELDYIRNNLDYDEDRYYVMKKIEEIKSKTPVDEKQYEHIGYIDVHFSESASFEDDIRPVIALQTLTDCVKYKDGKYKTGSYFLDRKDNAQGYSVENCVPCCTRCNRGKGAAFSYEEWKEMTSCLKSKR